MTAGQWGKMRLRTVGRRTGEERTATVDLVDWSRAVHGRAADPDEGPRLWAKWAGHDKGLDGHAAMRSRETAVVILEPRPATSLTASQRWGLAS